MNTQTRLSLGRRRFLIGSAASGLILGTTTLWSWQRLMNHREVWIEAVIRNNMRGVVLDEATLQKFIQDILASEVMETFVKKAALATARVAPWVTENFPRARAGLKKLERQVLTEYLLGGNFFHVADARRETIVYHGRAAVCPNPFLLRT